MSRRAPPARGRRPVARRRRAPPLPGRRRGRRVRGLPGACAPPELFGICVAAVDGRVHSVGDAEIPFTIMSVAKPFTFALVCDSRPRRDPEGASANATGLPFNSLEAVEHAEDGRTNRWSTRARSRPRASRPAGQPRRSGRRSATGAARASPAAGSSSTGRCSPPPRLRTPQSRAAAALGRRGGLGCEPAGRGRRLHAAELPGRDRPRPGADGSDAGRRRRAAADGRAGRGRGHMPLRPHRDDDGGPVRDLGRLALRRRIAGEERDRRRHRDGVAGEGRPRHRLRRWLDAAGNSVRGQPVARFLSRRLGLDPFARAPDAAEPA